LGQAVTFDGWSGTVQSFGFLSEQYTMAFIQANQNKIVR
jgi:hypothetical protein